MLKANNHSTIQLNSSFLEFKENRYHYIWLRDHCLCPNCCDSWSGQKIYDINSRTHLPIPLSVTVKDQNLVIDWQEEPSHQSVFPIAWLLKNSYDPQPEPIFKPEYKLWDNDMLKINPPKQHDFGGLDPETWMKQLYTLGFIMIKNVPDKKAFESLITSIGPIRESARFGKFSPIKSVRPSSEYVCSDLGLSSNELIPHTDFSAFDVPHIVGSLYCINNTTTGGESILVDGFKLAEDLRVEEPDHFVTLTETLIDILALF